MQLLCIDNLQKLKKTILFKFVVLKYSWRKCRPK